MTPSMTPTAAALDVDGLSVDMATPAGPARILRDVSFTIPRGRIVGLVGESGSGKSTVALALLGLLPANAAAPRGVVRLDGTDLLTLPPAAMARVRGRRIAMVFQDPMTSLNPVFSVGAHLDDVQRACHPGRRRAERRARAVAVLERVGIADPARRLAAYPHQLSGGMRQRVMIAMALLAEPELLIADEPTSALDVTVEAQIARLLDGLRRDFRGAVLFISHSLGLVAELCDEVVVLYAGAVMETGPAAAVLQSPRHPYTRALLSCEIDDAAADDAPLPAIKGELPDLTRPPPGCPFQPRCALAVPACANPQLLRPVDPGRRAACHRA